MTQSTREAAQAQLEALDGLVERCYEAMGDVGQCLHDVEEAAVVAVIRLVAEECAKVCDAQISGALKP